MDLRETNVEQGAGQGAGRIKDKYRYILKANVIQTCKVSKDKQLCGGTPSAMTPTPNMPPNHVKVALFNNFFRKLVNKSIPFDFRLVLMTSDRGIVSTDWSHKGSRFALNKVHRVVP